MIEKSKEDFRLTREKYIAYMIAQYQTESGKVDKRIKYLKSLQNRQRTNEVRVVRNVTADKNSFLIQNEVYCTYTKLFQLRGTKKYAY